MLKGSVTRFYLLFFITYQKRNHSISRDTFSRWIRQVLLNTGIDSLPFSPPGLAASSAMDKHVPINTILKATSWQKECTFRRLCSYEYRNSQSYQLYHVKLSNVCLYVISH